MAYFKYKTHKYIYSIVIDLKKYIHYKRGSDRNIYKTKHLTDIPLLSSDLTLNYLKFTIITMIGIQQIIREMETKSLDALTFAIIVMIGLFEKWEQEAIFLCVMRHRQRIWFRFCLPQKLLKLIDSLSGDVISF